MSYTSLTQSSSIAQVIRHQLPWNFLLSQPMDNVLTIPEQMTPASSACPQSCCPQPREGHLHTWDSFPPQFSSSSQMGPDPWPNWANFKASRAPPQPSCLHTTRASSKSQPSLQMVPQEPWSRISTLPAQGPSPSTRRSCLLPEERETRQWAVDRALGPGMGRWGWKESLGPESPLRLQSLLVETRSFCTPASTWVWFLIAAVRIIRLKMGKNRKYYSTE